MDEKDKNIIRTFFNLPISNGSKIRNKYLINYKNKYLKYKKKYIALLKKN